MTPAGWLIMISSISAVLCAVSFSFYKVLTLPSVEAESTLKSEGLIDTGDTVDAD